MYSSLYREIRVWSDEYTDDWDEFKFSNIAPDLVPMLVEYIIDNHSPSCAYDTLNLSALIKCYLPNLRAIYVEDLLGRCIGHVLDSLNVCRDIRHYLYTNREGDILRYFIVMEQSDEYH